MPFKIAFYPNGKWLGGTRIPKELRDISSLSRWTKAFIQRFRDLGKMYSDFFSNDGELVGQEKANIVIELDGLIGGLLVFRRYLTINNPGQFRSLKNRYHYHFTIQMDAINWRGHGWFSNQYVFTTANFLNWYNNIMMHKLMELFKMYALAMEDNVLTDQERQQLIRFIETIIFDILVIEKVLISTNISQ